MKIRSSRLNRLILRLAWILVSATILWDLVSILQTLQLRKQITHYSSYELTNLDSTINEQCLIIQNTILFQSKERKDRNIQYLNLSGKSAYEVNEIIEASLPKNEYWRETFTEDKITLLNDIANSNTNALSLLYEKYFHLHLLSHVLSELQPSCSFGVPQFQFMKPITEDSIYTGGSCQFNEHCKFEFLINNVRFTERFHSCAVPISDTLEITTYHIENNFTSIDTTSSHQTIVKSNGKWRNITSL